MKLYNYCPINFLSVMPVQIGTQEVIETTGYRSAPECPKRYASQALTVRGGHCSYHQHHRTTDIANTSVSCSKIPLS